MRWYCLEALPCRSLPRRLRPELPAVIRIVPNARYVVADLDAINLPAIPTL